MAELGSSSAGFDYVHLYHEARQCRDRLLALTRVAAEAQSAATEDEVLGALCTGAVRAGLSAYAALRSPNSTPPGELTIRALSLKPDSPPSVERSVGQSMVGARISTAPEPLRAALEEQTTTLVTDTPQWIAVALPWLSEHSADRMRHLSDFGEAICGPITDGQSTSGVLVVWGPQLTDFDRNTIALLGRLAGTALLALRQRLAERERLRLDGALLLARTAAHELNNALSLPVGYADLLTRHPAVRRDPQLLTQVEQIRDGAQRAAKTLERLQNVVRLAEKPSPAGNGFSVLDLDRSTTASRP
jgi:hypothetical protein